MLKLPEYLPRRSTWRISPAVAVLTRTTNFLLSGRRGEGRRKKGGRSGGCYFHLARPIARVHADGGGRCRSNSGPTCHNEEALEACGAQARLRGKPDNESEKGRRLRRHSLTDGTQFPSASASSFSFFSLPLSLFAMFRRAVFPSSCEKEQKKREKNISATFTFVLLNINFNCNFILPLLL